MQLSKPFFELEQFGAVLLADPRGEKTPVPVIAHTPGVRAEQIAECRRLAYLNPVPQAPLAFGVFRGDTIDYILAKALLDTNRLPQYQYAFIPTQVMEQLGGNVFVFESFARTPIPVITAPSATLIPLCLDRIDNTDLESQQQALQFVIDTCKEDTSRVGILLAALVHNVPIDITNAPPDLKKQFTFVQGLLALLPGAIRHEITFAVNIDIPSATSAQIQFLVSTERVREGVTFNWLYGEITGTVPQDSYTKYILTQLKLDISVVIQQTAKLTSIFTDYLAQGDMEYALAWAARRALTDSAVQDRIPFDKKLIADILKTDTTLPDDLKVAYCRHLLTFVLAFNDFEDAGLLWNILRDSATVADVVYEQLKTAAESANALAVVDLIERWTLSPDAARWMPLLGQAAITHTQFIIDHKLGKLPAFFEKLDNLPFFSELKPAAAQIISIARPYSYRDPNIARTLLTLSGKYLGEQEQADLLDYTVDKAFVLWMMHLPADELQQMIEGAVFFEHLPPELRAVLEYLKAPTAHTATPDMLVQAASAYGAEYQPLLLARLMELALLQDRDNLIDLRALYDLIRTSTSVNLELYGDLFPHVIAHLKKFYRHQRSVVATQTMQRQQAGRFPMRIFAGILIVLSIIAVIVLLKVAGAL